MRAKTLITVLSLVGCACCAPTKGPTVTIANGAIVGTTTQLPHATQAANKYLGIPFAASPPERFSPPTDPARFTEAYDATAFKPACIQQFNYPKSTRDFTINIFNNPPPPESEDCLYLNVFTPACKGPKRGRAVMFWIYGGNLQFGYGGLPTYDGSSFAANQDVVVVTINYRTNVFGFSNSPQIPLGKQNAGFLDQRKALEWVQCNIAAFGGDPRKVTIFGESAGGYSVKQLVANPPKPLTFRAAILESEAAALPGSGLANWQALVAEVGCTAAPSQIDCVRAIPAATIKNVIEQQSLAFAPVSDQVTASSDVRSNFITHKAAQVPLFFGSNSQEGRVFAAAAGLDTPNPPITSAQFLNATFPGQPAFQAAIAAAYPADVVAVPYLLASAVITDATFTCPISALSTLARLSGYDVWRYYFNASFPNTQLFPNAGVYHASEIPEVFGTYPTEGATAQEINLSVYMQRVWAHFAKHPATGIPWPELGTNRGVELGDLGGNGIDGEKTIPLISVDYICAVYAPLIAVQGL